jgi:dihydropteroate synthase
MHMLGDPRTMQRRPRYDDVVAEVADFLVVRAERARAAGVEEVWIDPGIGFGKTTDHNLALLAHLDVLVATGFPVLVATSRKRFLGQLLAAVDGAVDPVPADDRIEGSVATAVWSYVAGVAMVRAHDVAATVVAAWRASSGVA